MTSHLEEHRKSLDIFGAPWVLPLLKCALILEYYISEDKVIESCIDYYMIIYEWLSFRHVTIEHVMISISVLLRYHFPPSVNVSTNSKPTTVLSR